MEVVLLTLDLYGEQYWTFEIKVGAGKKREGSPFIYTCPIKAVEAGNRKIKKEIRRLKVSHNT